MVHVHETMDSSCCLVVWEEKQEIGQKQTYSTRFMVHPQTSDVRVLLIDTIRFSLYRFTWCFKGAEPVSLPFRSGSVLFSRVWGSVGMGCWSDLLPDSGGHLELG